MAQTETQVLGTELERVTTKVPTLFDRDAMFYANIEKRPVEVISSRDMRIPLELRPGGLFGHYEPAGGDLGRGEGPSFDKAVINTVHLKFAVEWHKKTQWSTDNPRKAVINSFRHLLAKSMAEFRRNVDSLCMTGGNGVLATVTSFTTVSGNNVIVCTTDGFGVRLLRYGQRVRVWPAALTGAPRVTAVTITGQSTFEHQINYHDLEGHTFKIPTVTGLTIGDKIVVSGTSDTDTPTSMLGVPYHHNSATTGQWLGFDRSTTPEIRANRVAAGGSFSLPFARLAMNRIGNRLGADSKQKMQAWMHPCQEQAYEDLAQDVQQINRLPNSSGGGSSFDLYFSGDKHIAGVPIRTSFSWDKTRIDWVVNNVWGRAEFHPPGFYEEEGRRIFELRGDSGGVAAASIFYIVASFNLFVDNPPGCSYVDTLTVPAGYQT